MKKLLKQGFVILEELKELNKKVIENSLYDKQNGDRASTFQLIIDYNNLEIKYHNLYIKCCDIVIKMSDKIIEYTNNIIATIDNQNFEKIQSKQKRYLKFKEYYDFCVKEDRRLNKEWKDFYSLEKQK